MVSDEEFNKYNTTDFYCPIIPDGVKIVSYQLEESLVTFRFWADPNIWDNGLPTSPHIWKL